VLRSPKIYECFVLARRRKVEPNADTTYPVDLLGATPVGG
jgi:hypothetical protein